MARKKSTVKVDVDGSAAGLEAALQKAGSAVDAFGKKTKQSLDDSGKGLLDKLAARAKELKAERRKSGEAALEGAVRDPINFALDSMGMGVQGFIADQIGRGIEKITGAFRKIQEGADPGKMVTEAAEGLPVVGGFVAAWNNVFAMIEGSASALREANAAQEKLNLTTKAYDTIMRRPAFLNSGFGEQIASMGDKLKEDLKPYDEAIKKLENPTDEQVSARMGAFSYYVHNMRLTHMIGLGDTANENIENARANIAAESSGDISMNWKAKLKEKTDYTKRMYQIYLGENERHDDQMYAYEQKSLAERNALNAQTAKSSSAIWDAEAAEFKRIQDDKVHTYQDAITKMNKEVKDIKEKYDKEQDYIPDPQIIGGRRKNVYKITLGQRMENLQAEAKQLGVNITDSQGRYANFVGEQKEDFWRNVRNERRNVEIGELGGASGLINRMESISGPTFESNKMQKLLGAITQHEQFSSQIDAILNNPNASAGQKAAAKKLGGLNDKVYELASSEKVLNQTPYIPLQFAGAQEVGSRYTGAAAAMQEQDRADYAKSTSEYTKSMDATLKEISNNIGKMQMTSAQAPGASVFGSM